MIKDRNGNFIFSGSSQNSLLEFLYGSLPGRLILKPLVTPKVSNAAGKFMDSVFSVPLIMPFIKLNDIDMSQYQKAFYTSFNDFFTRKIKKCARPINKNPKILVSPCDSKLTVYPINKNSIFKIKGSFYSLSDIFENQPLAEHFNGGLCLVFRLCVDDYHRYCYFDSGIKSDNFFISGVLHTVNPIAFRYAKVYERNCREYTVLKTDNFGTAVQAEVGAMLVGKIHNHHGKYKFSRGEEKGMFLYGGSTIILVLEKDSAVIDRDILTNSSKGVETLVKMGEKIGHAKPH